MTADEHRRAVRITAEHLNPGMRVTRWNDRLTPHREVAAVYRYGNDTVLVEWADGHVVSCHHDWDVFHRRG